jgi:tRNA-splicing ligase RtcB
MNKKIKIFWRAIEQEALNQFYEVMKLDDAVQWALMPDAHTWYVLPIWWVVVTKSKIYPAFIWYDIWCGVLAYPTIFSKSDLIWKEQEIFKSIYKDIPCWEWKFREHSLFESWWNSMPHTSILNEIMKKWIKQIWTLWWWNHFIEIAYDEKDNIWIVIHSWSRSVWHKIATHYMTIAKWKQTIDIKPLEIEFDSKESNKQIKKHNPEKYEEIKWFYVEKKVRELTKWSVEWTYWLDIESEDWKNYIKDMNFCLEYALENRLQMLYSVNFILSHIIWWFKKNPINDRLIINRNHNHAELKNWLWIHRKWATHAEKWMLWVIPWNMRDWSFIVEWLWNEDSICSSSHWWGRVMSRTKVKESVSMEEFKKTMEWIVAKVDLWTLDECPMAYKDIFEVMDLQKDLVKILHYLKPIINIKW